MSEHQAEIKVDTLSENDWEPQLKLLHNMSGLGFSVLDPAGKKLAQTEIDADICKLMHSSETGRKMCKECWARCVEKGVEEGAQVHHCPAHMANVLAPVRRDKHFFGYLVCGEARVDDDEHTKRAKAGLTQLANEVNIPSDQLIDAYLASPAISQSELDERRGRLNGIVEVTSKMADDAWLVQLTHRIQACTDQGGLAAYWQTLTEVADLLFPASDIDILTVAPGHDSLARVHPRDDRPLPMLRGEDLQALMKRGYVTRDEGLFVAGRTNEKMRFMLHIQREDPCSSIDTDRVLRFTDIAAGTLTLLHAQVADASLATLTGRLSEVDGPRERLEVILTEAARRLGCEGGYVALTSPESGEWLRVVARLGAEIDGIPYFVPSNTGITGRVLRNGTGAVVPRTSEDPDYHDALHDEERVIERYSEQRWKKYRQVLRANRACVKLPLTIGNDSYGIICFHRTSEGPFDLDSVHVVGALADRAAVEAACFLSAEAAPGQLGLLRDAVDEAEGIAARFQHESLAVARDKVCKELARLAMTSTGAYRVAVRLISLDHQTLSSVAVDSCKPEAWPTEFEKPFPLNRDSAATHAFKTGKSYTIEDTEQAGIHYIPLEPVCRSHASIVLRSGTQPIGVLSVDWDCTGAFTPAMISSLQALAHYYANALRLYDVDLHFRSLEADMEGTRKDKRDVDYCRFLKTAAEMVGVHQGAVFIRRRDTGRFHLAAHLLHPEWTGDDHFYESGEGITGWIAANNRPLNIKNLDDEQELKAIDSNLQWKDQVFDGYSKDSPRNMSYLGVPIAAGNEVLGVLRLANAYKGAFSPNDLQIALSAASLLAGVLIERDDMRRTQALMRLSTEVAAAKSQKQVGESIFEALKIGIGDCACHIRILDKRQWLTGEVQDVLSRLTVSKAEWRSTPYYRERGRGIAGWVWETGDFLLYQELEKEPWIKDAMIEDLRTVNPNDLLEMVGSGACAPIVVDDAFLGTLHVHKQHRYALSPRDTEFIKEVARFAGRALQNARKAEENKFTIELEEAIDAFFIALVRGHSVNKQEGQLLRAALTAIHDTFACQWALMALPDCLKSRFTPSAVLGVDVQGIPDVIITDAIEALGEERFRLLSCPALSPLLLPLITPNANTDQDTSSEANACVMAIVAEGNPIVLFTVSVPAPDHISYRRARHVANMLRRIGELVLMGRNFEQQKRDAEVSRPLALLGSVISGYEHQLFGPLSRLKLGIEFLAGRNRPSELVQSTLADMARDRGALASCLERLRGVVGRWERGFTRVEMAEVLQKAIGDVTAKHSGLAIASDIPSDSAVVRGNSEYLRSAFQLLIRNALEAVETKKDRGSVVVSMNAKAGDQCVISIEDNGTGMSEDVRRRAFEPFYSNKTTGTGMGLPATFCIIRCHHGDLQIESTPGQGTVVRVCLPLYQGT